MFLGLSSEVYGISFWKIVLLFDLVNKRLGYLHGKDFL